jgi:DNA-directed RNA polymerase specialized sigma24 family protein
MIALRELSAETVERAARHEQLVREMRSHRQSCCGTCLMGVDGVSCAGRRAADRSLEQLMGELEPLLRSFARNYVDHYNELDDLLGHSRIHALRAIERWTPGGAASVSTWVVMYLRSELARLRHRQHRTRAHATALGDGMDPPAPEEPESSAGLTEALSRLAERLDPDDAFLLAETAAGRPPKSPWARGRIRSLVAHPAAGVAQAHVVGEPEPRAVTPVDVDADADALRIGSYPQSGWELLAACTDIDIRDVMPARGAVHSADLKTRCESCPVRVDCLAAGVAAATWPGTWGGHPLKARSRIRSIARSEPGGDDPRELEHAHTS